MLIVWKNAGRVASVSRSPQACSFYIFEGWQCLIFKVRHIEQQIRRRWKFRNQFLSFVTLCRMLVHDLELEGATSCGGICQALND